MKITNYENVANLYKANQKRNIENKGNLPKTSKTDKSKNTSSAVIMDKAEISQEALFLQKVQMAVKAAPDIREDKVNEIKSKMKNGEYNVTTEMLVEKLLSGK